MICGNDLARQYRDQLLREAHVPTTGVRVTIVHPRFTTAMPEYRNGTVRIPASLMRDPDLWIPTWRHELQHAADDRSGLLRFLSHGEAEARARRAERPREGGGR